MIVGALCMSHSPLLDRIRAPARFDHGARFAHDLKPDQIVVFYPGHVNGFFYSLLPSICVGIQGNSIGDLGTAAGRLDIPEMFAMDCAQTVIGAGVDAALSYKMDVDHGAVQPLEFISTRADLPPFIRIVTNCAAASRPIVERVRTLREAVGKWAQARSERILIVASGGLSHVPLAPSMAGATTEVRQSFIESGAMLHHARLARQNRSHAEGHKATAGPSTLLPHNPEWDRSPISALVEDNLSVLDDVDCEEMTEIGGRGGHEVRTWFAALSAMKIAADGTYTTDLLFYEPIDAWLSVMGIMTELPATSKARPETSGTGNCRRIPKPFPESWIRP